MSDDQERAERDEARDERTEAREIAGAEREVASEAREVADALRAGAQDDVLEQLQSTLASLDETMQSLIAKLEVVGDSNEQIKRWKVRATVALWCVGAAVAIVALVGWKVWRDGIERDRNSERDRAALSITTCQTRNSSQQDNRDRFARLFDTIEDLGIDKEDVDVLRSTIGTPEGEDRDCDANGRLDANDYATP